MSDEPRRAGEAGSVDPSIFRAPRSWHPGLRAAGSLGAVAAAALLLGAAWFAGQLGPPSAQSGGFTNGDRVVATGVVVVDATSQTCLSAPFPVRLGGLLKPIAHCPPISVPVRGVQVSGLPDWTATGAGGFSGLVTVEGTWDDGLVAQTVAPAPPPTTPDPEVPCSTPVGGWPNTPAASLDYEAALARLNAQLAQAPTQYVGLWTTVASPGRVTVAVVGTVTAPDGVRAQLARVFPYALCVTRVAYSTADLEGTAAQLSRPDGTWGTDISVSLDRVVVHLAVVDDAAAATLTTHPDATADPLVRRE